MRTISVAHLTSVHSRLDVRIFLKECRSLGSNGYQVTLIVADGEGNEVRDGIQIIDAGRESGRLRRMTRTPGRILEHCRSIDVDIVHLHDPELLTISNKLKNAGKRVIFDAHEDGPAQILGKPYINPLFRGVLARMFGAYEARVCRNVDAVVAATPTIRDKFLAINSETVDINNYPIQNELHTDVDVQESSRKQVCYVGGIAEIRGIRELVQAMELVQSGTRLKLCGQFAETHIEEEVRRFRGWTKVDAEGFVDRLAVRDVLRDSIAGLVTFHPMPNHMDAQPNKMFEYMSAAVPVIASDFPLWRDIVEGNDCGICVDPMRPQSIADAIDFLAGNPDRAGEMGENGRRAVRERYNWSVEEDKLLALYARLSKRLET